MQAGIDTFIGNVVSAMSSNPTLLIIVGCSFLAYKLLQEILKQIGNYQAKTIEEQRKIAIYIAELTANKLAKQIAQEFKNHPVINKIDGLSDNIKNSTQIISDLKDIQYRIAGKYLDINKST